MVLFYKKISFFLLSVTTLLLLAGCSPVVVDEEGDVSGSTSSSETGDGFIVKYDGSFSHTASVVIGQSDFISFGDEITAANSVSTPFGNPTVVDGMLYLPDLGNSRTLGYDAIPNSNGASADFAIGQDSLTEKLSDSTSDRNDGVQTVTVSVGKTYVTDWGNSRILIYKQRPLSGPAIADIVVGQVDFGQGGTGLADNRLNLPESLYIADNKLIVADSGNNRVLIWNSIPNAHGAAADIVLGQSDFTTNTIVAPTASSLNFPTAVWSDGIYLAVLDAGNNRILVWNSFATLSSGEAADAVLGQEDFSSNLFNQGLTDPTASTLSFTTDGGGLYSNGSQLFVADSGNNRIMVWDFPLTQVYNQAATALIGQADFARSGDNRETGVTGQNTFSTPTGVYQFYDRLIVTDTGNNRYLIFNSQ